MGQRLCSAKHPAQPEQGRSPTLVSTLGQGKLTRTRSSTNVTTQLRCAERSFSREGEQRPVKVVVFDLDETLTLTTFMSGNGSYTQEQHEFTAQVNFESPWVEGSRVQKLHRMFEGVAKSYDGTRRPLAVLTRNNNPGGVQAVLNLLRVAGFEAHFDAIWAMPWRGSMPNGAYKEDSGKWILFNPPINKVRDHKAHVLLSLAANPKAWFPQLGQPGCEFVLPKMVMENIVLVDDQRLNFQSEDNTKVLRYCMVAKYDARYHDFGLLTEMGGIGAHDDHDYEALQRFVEEPWSFKEELKVTCREMFDASQLHVKLAVFDFDETLTLATFMPECQAFCSDIDWTPGKTPIEGWSDWDLVKYNFETPWVRGRRPHKLRKMLARLQKPNEQDTRGIIVLTQNSSGAIAVLNLLRVAQLDEYFSAVWCFSSGQDAPHGVYWDDNRRKWASAPPVEDVNGHKADILKHLVENTARWLPQIADGAEAADGRLPSGLHELLPENVVLVDDERLTCRTDTADGAPLSMRLCQVTHYDDFYRDCGMLTQMGGIGAHTDEDYETLLSFCSAPWEFPCETFVPPRMQALSVSMREKIPTMKRERADTDDGADMVSTRTERRRGTTAYFAHPLDDCSEDGSRHSRSPACGGC